MLCLIPSDSCSSQTLRDYSSRQFNVAFKLRDCEIRNPNPHDDMDVFTYSDRDIGPDFDAATVQPVVAGPQQQDQLQS